jgi:hypothetical protein
MCGWGLYIEFRTGPIKNQEQPWQHINHMKPKNVHRSLRQINTWANCMGTKNSRSLNSLQSSLRTHRVDQSQDTTAICMVFFRCLPKLHALQQKKKKKASIFTWCFLRRLPNKLNLAHIWMYIITAWTCYIAFFFFDRNMECWPLYWAGRKQTTRRKRSVYSKD